MSFPRAFAWHIFLTGFIMDTKPVHAMYSITVPLRAFYDDMTYNLMTFVLGALRGGSQAPSTNL